MTQVHELKEQKTFMTIKNLQEIPVDTLNGWPADKSILLVAYELPKDGIESYQESIQAEASAPLRSVPEKH